MTREQNGGYHRSRLCAALRATLCPGVQDMERLSLQCGTTFLEFFTALTVNS